MKKYLFLLAAGQCATVAHAQTAPINQRVENQRDRIAAGRASGQLTGREARNLRGEERGIKAQARTERAANGGHLTGQERRQIKGELNQNSRQIRRKRTN